MISDSEFVDNLIKRGEMPKFDNFQDLKEWFEECVNFVVLCAEGGDPRKAEIATKNLRSEILHLMAVKLGILPITES